MTNLSFCVNGVQHPSEPLVIDCSSPFGATRAYEKLFSSTGVHRDDSVHMIILGKFTKCFYLLGFDLIPDREFDKERISPPHHGNVRIEARFKKPLTETIAYILYADFPGHIEIENSETLEKNEYPFNQ